MAIIGTAVYFLSLLWATSWPNLRFAIISRYVSLVNN